MLGFILNLLLSALAVVLSAYFLPGVTVDTFVTALIVALILGLINAVIKPIINILTLPINILTLGLFSLVINALFVMVVDYFVPGFKVDGILWALIFSVVMSLVGSFLSYFNTSK